MHSEITGERVNSLHISFIFFMVSEPEISHKNNPNPSMSSPTQQSQNLSPSTFPSSESGKSLIALNITAQINEKLTPSTFAQWCAQFEALLIGYDLLDYINGDIPCPSTDLSFTVNPNKTHWVRQDKLVLSAILASTSPKITPLVATAKTSQQAWQKLHTLYVSRSRTRVMQLKEELTLIQRGNRTITDYLHTVKTLADEIAIIDQPLSDDDLTLHILHGLGADFREIVAPIRTREKSLTFEELHDLLIDHETYMCRLEAATQQLVISANYTNRTKQSFSPHSSYSPRRFNKNNGQSRSPIKTHENRWVSQGQSPTYSPDNRWASYGSNRPSRTNRRYQPRYQICDNLGHITKTCSKLNSNTAQ